MLEEKRIKKHFVVLSMTIKIVAIPDSLQIEGFVKLLIAAQHSAFVDNLQ